MTIETGDCGQEESKETTLWGYQGDVRRAAERLRGLLVWSGKEDEPTAPALSHIEEMIEYERGTLAVLREAIGQAERLGKE